MEHNQFPVKLFSAVAIVTTLTFSACNNNDTNPAPSATTDTPAAPAVTTMPADSITPSATDTSGMRKTGMAKPNTAKKGMKGKVMINIPAPSTAKADAAPDAQGVYMNVDHIPAFPGGNAGLQKYFDDHVQYPSEAQDMGVEGTVRIAFTVDENGKLMNPRIEGDQQGYGLDEEALRVINGMPKWVPGSIKGKPVKTQFVLPVNFALNN